MDGRRRCSMSCLARHRRNGKGWGSAPRGEGRLDGSVSAIGCGGWPEQPGGDHRRYD
jgi:hypothetical protein